MDLTEVGECSHELLVVRDFFEACEVGEITEPSRDGEPLFESVQRFGVIWSVEVSRVVVEFLEEFGPIHWREWGGGLKAKGLGDLVGKIRIGKSGASDHEVGASGLVLAEIEVFD